MMAENYVYRRDIRLVADVVRRGLLGQITCADAAYVHDLRSLMLTDAGALTWRGELQRDWNSASYPTHALAGVHAWLQSAGASTEFATLTASSSRSVALPRYVRSAFGAGHPGADPGFWRHGDSVVTLLKTKDGVLVTLRVDMVSARPYDTMHNTLQGTTGAFVTGRHEGESQLIWIDEKAGSSGPADWRPLDELRSTYGDPRWDGVDLTDGPEYRLWDRLLLEDFADYVQLGQQPPFDVHAAVNLSAVIPLSEASTAAGGAPMTFPDFS
jgi:predicted dehydrogenase